LIVDESAESREVLRALLERRGAVTIEAPRAELAVDLAKLHRPDLIVLDVESDHSASGSSCDNLRATADRTDTPVLILGTLSRQRGKFSDDQFVAKPYHYAPLIRKIEDLLGAA
jgi:DNA-binding response OmpR family regulator